MAMKLIILFLVVLTLQLSLSYPLDDLVERESALSFLNSEQTHDFMKRLLYTPKEQRREAKEKYEEKCERKLLSAALHKPRWCPELTQWPEWVKVTAGDGTSKKG